MANITLNSITLPNEMTWEDEFADSSRQESDVRTLSGDLIRQTGVKDGGRSIHLIGGWITRTTVLALKALQDTGATATLTLHDSRTFTVYFADASALSVTPVINYHTPASTDYYTLELRLIEAA